MVNAEVSALSALVLHLEDYFRSVRGSTLVTVRSYRQFARCLRGTCSFPGRSNAVCRQQELSTAGRTRWGGGVDA